MCGFLFRVTALFLIAVQTRSLWLRQKPGIPVIATNPLLGPNPPFSRKFPKASLSDLLQIGVKNCGRLSGCCQLHCSDRELSFWNIPPYFPSVIRWSLSAHSGSHPPQTPPEPPKLRFVSLYPWPHFARFSVPSAHPSLRSFFITRFHHRRFLLNGPNNDIWHSQPCLSRGGKFKNEILFFMHVSYTHTLCVARAMLTWLMRISGQFKMSEQVSNLHTCQNMI